MITAIIVAGGNGSRMKTNKKKQYININNKPLLAWAIEAFQKCERIDEIVVVTNDDYIEYCKKNIIDKFCFNKVKKVIAGGVTRRKSVYNGLTNTNADYVLIHDGARPCITVEDINRCIDSVIENNAVCMSVPAKDTIKITDEKLEIKYTPERKNVWMAQTPQAFKYDIILRAHKQAEEDSFEGTDDCSLVERIGQKVVVTEGSYSNIKVTTQEDLVIVDNILNQL